MSKRVIFPYGISLREGGNFELFPAAEVGFLNKSGELITLLLIVDSGATVSALPKSDALVFGLDVTTGKQMFISGIDNLAVSAWIHNLTVKIGGKNIKIPVAFLEAQNGPRVLGRAGIFDIFTIIFEEQKRRTALLSVKSQRARAISGLIEGG